MLVRFDSTSQSTIFQLCRDGLSCPELVLRNLCPDNFLSNNLLLLFLFNAVFCPGVFFLSCTSGGVGDGGIVQDNGYSSK